VQSAPGAERADCHRQEREKGISPDLSPFPHLILDHQTQKVYRRFAGNMGDAVAVEQLIGKR